MSVLAHITSLVPACWNMEGVGGLGRGCGSVVMNEVGTSGGHDGAAAAVV